MSNLKICGQILQDQFELLNLIADEQDVEVPVGNRSFKNMSNKEKAHLNTCLMAEILDNFMEEIQEQQKKHFKAINTFLTIISKCETIEQLKMLTELDVIKEWKQKLADSGLLGDDADCECENCSEMKQSINEVLKGA